MFALQRAADHGRDLRPAIAGIITAVVAGCGFYFLTSARMDTPQVQAAGRMPIPGDSVAPKPTAISLDLDAPSQPSVAKSDAEPPVSIEPVREESPHVEVVAPGVYGLPEPQQSISAARRDAGPGFHAGKASVAVSKKAGSGSRQAQANRSDEDVTPRQVVTAEPQPDPEPENAKEAPDPPPVVREPARPVERKPIEIVQAPSPRIQPRVDDVSARSKRATPKPPPARVDSKKPGRTQSASDSMADWHRRFMDDP